MMKQTLTLEDLLALNDEILALVRAGVPLDHGLANLGRDLPGRLGAAARTIAERLAAGESLNSIAEDEQHAFPPVYGALVVAGARSGDLAGALQALAATTRGAIELRRAVLTAFIYPVLVLLLAYSLLVLALVHWVPFMVLTYERLGYAPGVVLNGLTVAGQMALWWAPWPPMVILALVLWRVAGSRAAHRRAAVRTRRWAWPTLRSVSAAGRLAIFAEMLALLIKHAVPLEEALLLAAQASADQALVSDARQLSQQLRGGQRRVQACAELPPLLVWLLAGHDRGPHLVAGLSQAASLYRDEAARGAEWFSVYVPMGITIGVGGTLALTYALVVLGPWYQLLYRIG